MAKGIRRGILLRPMGLAWLTLAAVGIAVVAFGIGLEFGSQTATRASISEAPHPVGRTIEAPHGRIMFAERLGESLELESYRTQFTYGDTIAWRAEFADPPPTNELTVVIEWYSIRERMKLSESTVTLGDAELTMIASDEVPLDELVPTAGLYAVTYYAGETRLAEGIFELLPRGR